MKDQNETLVKILENQLTTTEALAKTNELLAKLMSNYVDMHDTMTRNFARIDERFQRIDERFDRLEKRVDDNYIDLVNRIDEVELKVDLIAAEQKTFRHEQQVFNAKIDERVIQLETWRNTYL